MRANRIKSNSLLALYSITSYLTEKIRLNWLIKLKILIGLAIIGNKTAVAQDVKFPNRENKSDTLYLDVELKEDAVVLCYEVIVVDYKRVEPKFIGGQRALNRFVRNNVKYPEEAINKQIEGEISVNLSISNSWESFSISPS